MTVTQACVRFVIILAISWLLIFLVPMPWFISYYLPMSFFLLMGLVTFGICGLGWPLVAPAGKMWRPENRIVPGILMIILWIVLAVALAWVEENVWPAIPLGSPAGAWFGIIVFAVTLWYTFNGIGPHPFKQPWLNWLFASVLILVLTGVIWSLCVSFDAFPPLKDHPANPRGVFPGPFWFGLCVWIIVWIQVFGGPMCLQGWPFYKLKTPYYQITLTICAILLGYICWKGSLAIGISPTFSFGAIGASMIGWSLMHAVAFEMVPFAKHIQPRRGLYNFILEEIVLTAVWIVFLRIILIPINVRFQAGLAALGLPPGAMDINMLSAFFTLHVVAVVLLIHQFFLMRVPLSIPGPPLGPEEVPPPAEAASSPAQRPAPAEA